MPHHPDPLSVTVHCLRPGLAGQPCQVNTQWLRSRRTLGTLRATLVQDGSDRLEVLAAMGRLDDPADAAAPVITLPPPDTLASLLMADAFPPAGAGLAARPLLGE